MAALKSLIVFTVLALCAQGSYAGLGSWMSGRGFFNDKPAPKKEISELVHAQKFNIPRTEDSEEDNPWGDKDYYNPYWRPGHTEEPFDGKKHKFTEYPEPPEVSLEEIDPSVVEEVDALAKADGENAVINVGKDIDKAVKEHRINKHDGMKILDLLATSGLYKSEDPDSAYDEVLKLAVEKGIISKNTERVLLGNRFKFWL